MLREVGEKAACATGEATGEATGLTRRTVSDAVKTLDQATAAKKSITEERRRKELTTAVETAQKAIAE